MSSEKQHHQQSFLEEVEAEELRLERHFHVRHVHKYILGYLFVLLLVVVVASVYSWQHHQVARLERQVQNLSTQLEGAYR